MSERIRTPVVLRNGEQAVIIGTMAVGKFRIYGYRVSSGEFEMWTAQGRWMEDGSEHRFDILKFLTPDGRLVVAEGAIA